MEINKEQEMRRSRNSASSKKNGLVYSDAKEKANILNQQFYSVFTDEDLETYQT